MTALFFCNQCTPQPKTPNIMAESWVYWFYVGMFVWISILVWVLYNHHYKHKKVRKLLNYTQTIQGLIIENTFEESKLYSLFGGFYFIAYIFNPDPNEIRQKLSSKYISLINGYAQNIEIPLEIKRLITKFYKGSDFSTDSIIAQVRVSARWNSEVDPDKLRIGQKVEISFNAKDPNLWNIPTVVLDSNEYKSERTSDLRASLLCILCAIVIYVIIVSVYQIWYGLIYMVILIVFFAISYWLIFQKCVGCLLCKDFTDYKSYLYQIQQWEKKYEFDMYGDVCNDIEIEMTQKDVNQTLLPNSA